jgi:hypothetical protein
MTLFKLTQMPKNRKKQKILTFKMSLNISSVQFLTQKYSLNCGALPVKSTHLWVVLILPQTIHYKIQITNSFLLQLFLSFVGFMFFVFWRIQIFYFKNLDFNILKFLNLENFRNSILTSWILFLMISF